MKTTTQVLVEKLRDLKSPDLASTEHFIYRLNNAEDVADLQKLIDATSNLVHHNEIVAQCRELVKIDRPKEKFDESTLEAEALKFLEAMGGDDFGNYIYYPWSKKLIRILPEKEFIRLRTSRNKHKITEAEQAQLATKIVGVIGLSVGQSVAITMATERIFGTIRIADFDTLELSNLNRIRKGLDYLGSAKTTMVVREIAEIDPYLKVELFTEGITKTNLDDFLGTGENCLDILIEECDAFPIKIMARLKARALKIPVLMDTSDRGMMDVERFDLEPKRPIFHGLVEEKMLLDVGNLSEAQKVAILFKVVGGKDLSSRLKASLLEMNQTIGSWPQLASSVTLGGAITTDLARRILLDRKVESGRFYIDLNTLIPEKTEEKFKPPVFERPDKSLKKEAIQRFNKTNDWEGNISISKEDLYFIVERAGEAPSSGNDQPWEFVQEGDLLFVFHRKDRSFSFGDFKDIASIQSIGAAIENLRIAAEFKGYAIEHKFIAEENEALLKVVIGFKQLFEKSKLDNETLLKAIPFRQTNRIVEPRKLVPQPLLEQLTTCGESVENTEVKWLTDTNDLAELGEILSECDKIRVLHKWGHYDFFHREMRWTPEEAIERGDGIDIRTLEVPSEMMGAIKMLQEEEVIDTLRQVEGGDGFNSISREAINAAAAVGLVIRPTFAQEEFFLGGMAWERLWLKATVMDLAIHPLIAPLYLFPRQVYGKNEGLSQADALKLKHLRERFLKLWNIPEYKGEIFLFRLFKTNHTPVRALRLPLETILSTNV